MPAFSLGGGELAADEAQQADLARLM